MRLREAIDGSLTASRRGTPPDCPVGYVRTVDPYVFRPETVPCRYRVQTVITKACCGGGSVKTRCTKLDCSITLLTCRKCQEAE